MYPTRITQFFSNFLLEVLTFVQVFFSQFIFFMEGEAENFSFLLSTNLTCRNYFRSKSMETTLKRISVLVIFFLMVSISILVSNLFDIERKSNKLKIPPGISISTSLFISVSFTKLIYRQLWGKKGRVLD